MNLTDLTRMPTKANFYRREVYYREAHADIVGLLGESAGDVVQDSTLVMMKPDGLIAGKLRAVHSFVRDKGYDVVAVEEMILDAHKWRELWRYQLTAATIDRIALKEALYSKRPALIMLLRGEAGHGIPASVHLSGLKGSADPKAQTPGTLRSLLCQPNRVLSFVHFADEPADLVRELGVLFTQEQRLRLVAALGDNMLPAADAERLRAALDLDAEPRSSIQLAPALDRVQTVLRAHAESHHEPAARLAVVGDRLSRVAMGHTIDWSSWKKEIEDLAIPIDAWDLVLIGSYAIVADEPGYPKAIGNPPPGAWGPKG